MAAQRPRSFVDPVQLGSIELFCKAAELGSFTAAAESLGLTPAAVSRSVSRLEARQGVRLFVRSTRSIRLTGDGELYKAQCSQAAGADCRGRARHHRPPASAQRRAAHQRGHRHAHHRLLPLQPHFAQRYPEIEIELNISNRNIDFVEEGYDLAIRLGTPPDSRLIARKLEDAALGVFAAPAYLLRRGAPRTLKDLSRHDCIQFILPSSGRAMGWIFRGGEGQELDFSFRSPQRVHDDVLGCLSWAMAGGGLFQFYDFAAAAALQRGELVEVLQQLRGRSRPFSVLYPQNRHLSARVRVFVDFLTEALSRPQTR